MTEYDALVIEEIAETSRRERMLYIASRPKRRGQLIHIIHESSFLDPSVMVNIPSSSQTTEGILKQMQTLGAESECYAISALKEIDGKSISLVDGLERTVGNTVETILFCPKSRIGYYEGGHMKDRYILKGRSLK